MAQPVRPCQTATLKAVHRALLLRFLYSWVCLQGRCSLGGPANQHVLPHTSHVVDAGRLRHVKHIICCTALDLQRTTATAPQGGGASATVATQSRLLFFMLQVNVYTQTLAHSGMHSGGFQKH
jgi:hypothetical protein